MRTSLAEAGRPPGARPSGGHEAIRHPVVGDLILDWDTPTYATDRDQHLIVWTAEPGTPSRDCLLVWRSEQLAPAAVRRRNAIARLRWA
ncbi:MmyB family transcriptional regulator [Streptomyces sp. QTS52]